MVIIVYIIHKMIITLQRINYTTLTIMKSSAQSSEVYLICIIIKNQSKQQRSF